MMRVPGLKIEEPTLLSLLSNFLKHSLILISLITFTSCGLAVTRPKLEMSMAASAFRAAMDIKASKYAPNIYRKAEFYYLKAKSAYKRKYFNKAKQYAQLAQKFSEKAESIAAIKRAEEGV